MSDLVDLAINIATLAHRGQTDKAGQPYILHPLRVGAVGRTLGEQIVGFLHDTIEDTSITSDFIVDNFDSEIKYAVVAMSRGWKHNGKLYLKAALVPGWLVRETYEDFILRCLQNPISRRVKVYDIQDNLARADGLPLSDRMRLESKYLKALQTLKKGG